MYLIFEAFKTVPVKLNKENISAFLVELTFSPFLRIIPVEAAFLLQNPVQKVSASTFDKVCPQSLFYFPIWSDLFSH